MTDTAAVNNLGNKADTGIVNYFAGNLVAANLMMALMLIGGALSITSLNSQFFPTIDPAVINVTVPYPGATPAEVEEGVTRRAEEAVFGIEGVDRVVSKASENSGSLSIDLKDFVDGKKVKDDIEAAIDQIADFPPADAEEPNIVRIETLNEVMTIVVYSDRSEKHLRRGAEELEQALLALPSVSLVNTVGTRDYEISIEVSEDSLRQYGMTIDDVANAVRASSINLSSGELRTDAGDLLLRTDTKRQTGDEFKDIVLRARADGTLLRLGDVATINDGFVDVDLINQFNGRSSVVLAIKASVSEDMLQIAQDIKDMLSEYDPLPGITAEIWNDQSAVLKDRLNLLVRNGLLGFVLVFLFLVIMLDLRLAIWVAMGVPISFFGAFLFFDSLGVNINMVSLFALIIVLGIVVDDAIVVGENIISEHELGYEGPHAAVLGVRGVISPVTIGVLTTMAAFAPLLFVTGVFGQILGVVPLIVISVLAMSLVEAFFILPAHLAHGGSWSRPPLTTIQSKVSGWFEHLRDNKVIPLIRLAVKHRYRTLGLAFLFLVLSFSLTATGAVRFLFFPALEGDQLQVDIEFPIGTPFETTDEAAQRMLNAAYAVNESVDKSAFESISLTVGGRTASLGGPLGGTNMTVASNLASVQIQLHREPLRKHSATELERMWRAKVGEISGTESISYSAEQFARGTDIEYELSHPDEETLVAGVESLRDYLASLPEVYDIQDSFKLGKRQYDVELTSVGKAAGLTSSLVARQLRMNFFGEEVQRIQRGRQELKVMVRYPSDERRSMQDLYNARIRLADGTETSLRTVATLTESRGYSSIDRVDGARIVLVSAQIDTAMATPTEVNDVLQQEVLPALQEEYRGLKFKQAGRSQAQAEDMASLGGLALVALLVIYVMIASQLRSYAQPLVIMSAVPFGAGGALIGHFVLGFDLSFVSVFGIIALSGVVVNDSLILIDRYNRFRRESDLEPIEAIIAATQRRFRPIVLTTVTTALGLTPMLFETSIQAQFMIPMAVSLATGIVFASVIILFVVPILVLIEEDLGSHPA